MPRALIIVESPAKAKTIARFLGDRFEVGDGSALQPTVESSVGHVRDLPHGAKDVPAAFKGEKWANLGVDVDNDFKPLYVVSAGKPEVVKRLRKALKSSDELYLATDEDREGEAIAWHLLEVLNPPPDMPVRRMVFHEITPKAIEDAVAHPRDLDRRLVDAQETRRILDRLYGYEVSPVLWKKVTPGLSAGRVQSVALRLVVERERERMAFVAAGYWDVEAQFATRPDAATFPATLVALDGRRVATGRDFDADGRLGDATLARLDEAAATALADDLASEAATVRSVERKPYRRRPAAPFITSTFQQEAGRKLRISAQQAMRYAQSLYENGYITYMRTDSTTLSATALDAARREITERYGREVLPAAARTYARKVKNAQEAHEAIRPAGDRFRPPEDVAREVGPGEARVYDLIWKRTVASQMTDATGETVSVRLGATTRAGRDAEFATSGTVITHRGFLLAYEEGSDDEPAERRDGGERDGGERRLPPLAEGDVVDPRRLVPQGHETKPPARYTEASLVKKLEELGVGRPSTYASIMGTIEARGYVWKKGTALVPSFTAFAVISLLEQHFAHLVDYAFTARMEDDLDDIATGEGEMVPWLTEFYFGPRRGGERHGGLKELVSERLDEIDARSINAIPIGVDADGVPVEARAGRYGPYLSRGDDRASIPDDLAPDELTIEKAVELLEAPKGDRVVGTDPETGLPVLAKAGRFGPYVQLGEPEEGGKEKPRTASLFKTMAVETVTLDEALALLSLPRAVGTDPDTGEIITAQNGRYGPYLKRGDDSRSLETEDQIFGVTLDEALRIFAQPKLRRGQVAKPPLRDLGPDPATGLAMVVKDGRFGPYVTDGEINASLRKGDDVETLTVERASELLADRRAAGPAKKRARKGGTRKASKKASKKATTKTAKKATTKTAKKAAKKTAKKTTTKTAARSDEETAAPSTAAKAAPAGRRATPEPGV
jgi:DNA topoisomerase-1